MIGLAVNENTKLLVPVRALTASDSKSSLHRGDSCVILKAGRREPRAKERCGVESAAYRGTFPSHARMVCPQRRHYPSTSIATSLPLPRANSIFRPSRPQPHFSDFGPSLWSSPHPGTTTALLLTYPLFPRGPNDSRSIHMFRRHGIELATIKRQFPAQCRHHAHDH